MENNRCKTKDLAYKRIRQMIITGKLMPSQKVTEHALAIQLDLGRTPVREAVLALAHGQLVIIHPRKYIEIAPCSPERINEIFELRICLEPSVLRRHTRSINVVELLELKQRMGFRRCAYAVRSSLFSGQCCACFSGGFSAEHPLHPYGAGTSAQSLAVGVSPALPC